MICLFQEYMQTLKYSREEQENRLKRSVEWNRKRRQLRGWQLEKLGLPRPKGTVTAVSVYGVSPSALTQGALRMKDVEGVELG